MCRTVGAVRRAARPVRQSQLHARRPCLFDEAAARAARTGPRVSRVESALRELVYRSNRALVDSGLVTETFGNGSAVARAAGLFGVKPGRGPYGGLAPRNLVPV